MLRSTSIIKCTAWNTGRHQLLFMQKLLMENVFVKRRKASGKMDLFLLIHRGECEGCALQVFPAPLRAWGKWYLTSRSDPSRTTENREDGWMVWQVCGNSSQFVFVAGRWAMRAERRSWRNSIGIKAALNKASWATSLVHSTEETLTVREDGVQTDTSGR